MFLLSSVFFQRMTSCRSPGVHAALGARPSSSRRSRSSSLVNVVLGLVSYTVMAERKISAAIQDRIGPNRTGLPLGGVTIMGFTIPVLRLWGLGQPHGRRAQVHAQGGIHARAREQVLFLARTRHGDGAGAAHYLRYSLWQSARISVTVPLFNYYVMHAPGVIADVGIGVLLVFAIASLGVYGIVLAGWASNSKYPFLGGIRSSAQMISYEVSMGLSVIPHLSRGGKPSNLSKVIALPSSTNGWTVLPFVAHDLAMAKLGQLPALDSDGWFHSLSSSFRCVRRNQSPAL